MHSIYTTSGLVIDSREKGESGKNIHLFTRDLGLIVATAPAIREEKSKLRFSVQNFSLGNFSLVKGKEMWRLTGASLEISFTDTFNLEFVARISSLLLRLLHGEDPHSEVFDHIQKAMVFLSLEKGTLNKDTMDTLESVVIFRILHDLGYVALVKETRDAYAKEAVTVELLHSLEKMRKNLNIHINKALRESHL